MGCRPGARLLTPALWGFATAGRIIFGRGAIDSLGDVAATFGRRIALCTDKPLVEAGVVARAEAALRARGLDVCIFDGGEPEVSRTVVERCADWATEVRPDCLVGLGGGSNMDLAKATALLLSHGGPIDQYYGEARVPGPVLPVIAVPTTAGTGSEVTPVAVLADENAALKVGVSSHHLLPRWAILDPLLTVSCPRRVTAYSGMDALSHAIEALVAVSYSDIPSDDLGRVFAGNNPVSEPLAIRAIELIGANLRRAYDDGADLDAREAMLLGSLLAGMAFANAGTGIVHALQYPIGAQTKTAHGLGNALLLPAAMRFNMEVRAREFSRIAVALGCGGTPVAAVRAVRALADDLDIPANLQAIGVEEADMPAMAAQAIGIERLIRLNPRPVTVADLDAILRDAWRGAPINPAATTLP